MISPSMVGPVISVSSSAGWLGSGREKVVCKRASAAVERDGFSNTMSGRNIFRTRRMCDGHRGTGSRPGLLGAKGGEGEGRSEILR